MGGYDARGKSATSRRGKNRSCIHGKNEDYYRRQLRAMPNARRDFYNERAALTAFYDPSAERLTGYPLPELEVTRS